MKGREEEVGKGEGKGRDSGEGKGGKKWGRRFGTKRKRNFWIRHCDHGVEGSESENLQAEFSTDVPLHISRELRYVHPGLSRLNPISYRRSTTLRALSHPKASCPSPARVQMKSPVFFLASAQWGSVTKPLYLRNPFTAGVLDEHSWD